MRLQGKVALITGASQGIGAAIAERFVREGARVALCARRPGPLEALAERLRALGGSVTTAAFDVAEHERLTRFVEEQGTLDILVNNAPSVTYAPIADMEVEAFRRDFRVNVDAAFAATRAALKLMSARRSGSIINIASVSGLLALANLSAYGAAKAALIHFTRQSAIEGGPHNVRANAIAPGVINTPATAAGFSGPNTDWGRRIAEQVPLRRFGEPGEVASLALFLASEESAYISGTCICIDGGKAAELYVPQA
ncbi:MAG TPA: SDR family NAD(P)-dependent oxidoreductase [Steroidobacteraceae bacterium]|nr:SDR family NAD(P)-dependent oxidoreductase [Steroidobacteraceae bacterium]